MSTTKQCANVQYPWNAQSHITHEGRTLARTLPALTSLKALAGAVLERTTTRTMSEQCEETPRTLSAQSNEVAAHYLDTAWAEFEALLKRVAPYYQTPEHEYAEIRETAAKDIEAALQTYRLMAKELEAGHIVDGMGEERHRCSDCGNLTQRGRCLAAQRGEIDYVATFEPVQDVLRRCGKFKLKGSNNDE